MDAQRFEQVARLFEAARQRPPGTRTDFLNGLVGTDADLRDEVRALLNRHETAGEALETPVLSDLHGLGELARAAAERCPQRIGNYRIVRLLGEGGMGAVYLAEQDNPRRDVALKVIRPGLLSPGTLRRFDYEAHVLARLHHPGIAQIFEAGATSVEGRPQAFIAMELVRGRMLTEYVSQPPPAACGLREKIELCARVCDALQHAHQHGVIHRDLKPENILVGDDRQPKIVDFGVARPLDSDMRLTTARTGMGQFIGTLPYMSPEQICGDPDDVDTRSDIYATGVILYEMLTGRMPYDVRNRPLPEAARAICECPPKSMSSIDRLLRGDVETIVAKALEKDKARRYESAAELAADLRRYLAGEPIAARQDSALYVLRKQLRRYVAAVIAAACFVLVVTGFAVAMYLKSVENRRLARSERNAHQLADEAAGRLAHQLHISNIERGRLFARAGNIRAAEDTIWREWLQAPQSSLARWALWELYSHEPCLMTKTVQTDRTLAVVYSRDGRSVASSSLDRTITLWQAVPDGMITPVATLSRTVRGFGLSFSPDGRTLAVACDDGLIRVWDLCMGNTQCSWRAHRREVTCVAFSDDGGMLASGGTDGMLCLWNAASQEQLASAKAHSIVTRRVCFAPSNDLLASSGGDGNIIVWQLTNATLTRVHRLHGHISDVPGLAFSPDGSTLASASADRLIKVWDCQTGECRKTISSSNGSINWLAYSPDHRTLATGGYWRIDLWDANTLERRRSLSVHGGVASGSFSPDGRHLVIGFSVPEIRVWDVSSEDRIHLPEHVGRTAARFSPDGRVIVTGDERGMVRLWDAASGELMAMLQGHTACVRSFAFHPRESILATSGDDSTVRVWDLDTHACIETFPAHGRTSTSTIAFNPDGSLLAYICRDGTIALRRVPSGQVVATLPSDKMEAIALAFSPDGRMLASTSRARAVRLWNVAQRAQATSFTVAGQPWTVAFDSTSKRVAAGHWDATAGIWDASNGQSKAVLAGHGGLIRDVQFRPGADSMLATASADGTVRLWDTSSQQCLLTLDALAGGDIQSVSFSPDGRFLLACSDTGEAVKWDLDYFERHIAGNLQYQRDRLRAELGLP